MMTQTAFRFSEDLILRMKKRARVQGTSVNKYVEALIEKDLAEGENRYDALYKELSEMILSSEISSDLCAFAEKCKVGFTNEEIESDDKLSYLLSK